MRTGGRFVRITTAMLFFLTSQSFAKDFTVRTTVLGTLGGAASTAVAINNVGTVAGFSDTAARNIEHGFIWKNGRMTDLGALSRHGSSRGIAINNNDEVVGNSFAGKGTHAFIWKKGKMTDLGTLGGKNSTAVGINDRGEVIGNSETAKGATHAFLWKEGKMIDLVTLGGTSSTAVAINENGEVAGYSEVSRSKKIHAFLWRRNHMTDLGALSAKGPTYATNLNNKGQVIGDGFVSGSKVAGYVLKNSRLSDIGKLSLDSRVPDGVRTSDINEQGQVIGSLAYSDRSGASQEWGFLWENGTMMRIKGIGNPSGSTLFDINDKGWVAGFSSVPDKESMRIDQAFLWCNGKAISLGAKHGELSQALSLNEAGQVVGWRKKGSGSGNLWQHPSQAVLWEVPEKWTCEQEKPADKTRSRR